MDQCELIKLPTLKEYCDKLDSKVQQIYVFTQWGKLTDRCTKKHAVVNYGDKIVINFFEKSETIHEVYLHF